MQSKTLADELKIKTRHESDIHRVVWCKSAVLHEVKQKTERHGQRGFHWAGVVQQMFHQLTSQQLALQALEQQHPGCQKHIS